MDDADESIFNQGEEFLADVRRTEVGLDLGTKLFDFGELRVGALTGSTQIDPRLTVINEIDGIDGIDDDTGGWRALFSFDRLDNANFPRSGTFAQLELYLSRDNLGADREYDRLYADVGHAWEFGKWTQIAGLAYGTDLGSELPVYDAFRLGGFLNMSGLNNGELVGSRMGKASLVTYRKLGRAPGLFGGDFYLGGSLEAGNAWPEGMENTASLSDLRYSGSVFGGVDTLFGPVYVGWGLSEGGRSQWYLLLGRIFGTSRLTTAPRLGG